MGHILPRIQQLSAVVLLTSVLTLSESSAEAELLKGIIEYKPLNKNMVYGTLNCKGSTNVEDLLRVWIPKFEKFYPEVRSQLDFQGSGQGIDALTEGIANISVSSRKIKKKELIAFEELKGYAPTEVKVSLDALAIYVNRLNKIDEITIEELDAIFSTSLKHGYPKPITSWNTLTNINRKINIYLFDKNSGTRSYFRSTVMLKGDFNKENIVNDKYTKLSEVINRVANDPDGIAFGSAGSKNFKVKTLLLAKRKHFPSYKPSAKNIKKGNYPLTRFFYIYLDVPPHKTIPRLLYEFCKYILSKDGQQGVIRAGGVPLSPKQIGIELSKIKRDN